jgi:antitoxin component YwqK of YwqJK toxin-antitoxin module
MRPALILAIAISLFAPQKGEPPSAVGAQKFVSTFGRFSIALPNPTRFGPLAIPTPLGNARGHLFQWETKEATFGVGYGDATLSLEGPVATKQFFDSATVRFNKVASANSGSVAAVKQITLDNHPGIEQRVDLFTGEVIQRTFIVSRRVYEIVAVMNNNQKINESVALGVLDSFKPLSDAEIKTKQAEEAAKAEPSPLPQTPMPKRAGSDALDEGLHGRVKSVVIETEQERQRDNYNEQGNLVRSEWYDENGNVSTIKVYGYLNGSRVSTVKDITPDSDPLTVKVEPSPGRKPGDPRFVYRSEYKYDEKKRLTEELTFLNDGELWLRTVYRYNRNQKERLDYTEDGRVGQRVAYKLDDKGNPLEETVFNIEGRARYKTSYTYELDSNGNWTRRTAKRVEINSGRELPLPTAVESRTITYY